MFFKPISCTYRFCRDCWRILREDRQAILAKMAALRGEEEPPRSSRFQLQAESRSWDDVTDFVALLGICPDEDVLSEEAKSIVQMKPDMDGRMPPVIAEFIRKYYKPYER